MRLQIVSNGDHLSARNVAVVTENVQACYKEMEKFQSKFDIDLLETTDMQPVLNSMLHEGSLDKEVKSNIVNPETLIASLCELFESRVAGGAQILYLSRESVSKKTRARARTTVQKKNSQTPDSEQESPDTEDSQQNCTKKISSNIPRSPCKKVISLVQFQEPALVDVPDALEKRYSELCISIPTSFEAFERDGEFSSLVAGRANLVIADLPSDILTSEEIESWVGHIKRALSRSVRVAHVFCTHIQILPWVPALTKVGLRCANDTMIYVYAFDSISRTKLKGQAQGSSFYGIVAWFPEASSSHYFMPQCFR